MKTEILTSDLLNLVDPSKDGVDYKGQKIKIDFKQLEKLVKSPKKYEVYKFTGDVIQDLHKNLALYIINSDEPTLLSLDLNTPNIFKENSGLFEYIKNVYSNQEKSYISLPEDGDNLLLITSKNLSPLAEETSLEDAHDMHYLTAATVLSENPELNVKTHGQVTWQALSSDMYGDLNYVLIQLQEVFRADTSYHDRDAIHGRLFESLTEKINPELLASDEFKLGILDLGNKKVNEFFIQRYIDNKTNGYFIDFSLPLIKDHILKNVKNNQFTLLENLFDKFLSYRKVYSQEKVTNPLEKAINFPSLLNQPETIEHLLLKTFSSDSIINGPSDSFSIVSAYAFLSPEKQKNTEIVEKFIQTCRRKYGDGTTHIDDKYLFKLHPSVFNDKHILELVLPYLDFKTFKNHLKYTTPGNTLLSDKEFIISKAGKVVTWKLVSWIESYFNKTQIDKDFIVSILKSNGHLFESIEANKYKIFEGFNKDIDIISAAVEGGLSPSRMSRGNRRQFLLTDHDANLERIKINYLIEDRSIDDIAYACNAQGEELIKLKAKYLKPEYVFYQKDNWHVNTSAKSKTLSNVTTSDEVLDILSKIETQNFKHTFMADLFYKSLPKNLQKDKKILNKILDLGVVHYASVDESLAFNCNIAIKCLKKHKESLKDIPHELFTNSKFALNFAQLMDDRILNKADIPSFVMKFFENQEIDSKYAERLKEHLFYTNMQADLDKPIAQTAKTKRAKI